MTEKINIIVIFSAEADNVLADLIKKYNLQEGEDAAFDDTEKDIDPKEIILINLIEGFVLEKISNTEFLEALHKGLGTSKETTKNIALDIVHNLIPLLEKVPEDKLEEYNRKKSEPERKKMAQEEKTESKKEDFQEELLNKIRASAPIQEQELKEEPPAPGVKKVDITDVEKNAEKIKQERKPIVSGTQPEVKPATPTPAPSPAPTPAPQPPTPSTPPPQSVKPDPYKEPLD